MLASPEHSANGKVIHRQSKILHFSYTRKLSNALRALLHPHCLGHRLCVACHPEPQI